MSAWFNSSVISSFLRALARRAAASVRLVSLAAWRGFLSFYNSDDLTFAASIAYYALLSLFPFFLLVFAILGTMAADDADRGSVLGFVLRYFPRQFEFVTLHLDSLRATAPTLGIAGSLLMIWAALGVFGAITSAVNHAWGVEKQPSYLKHKLISFVMLATAGMLLITALTLISFIGVVEASWFATVLARTPGLAVARTFTLRHAPTALFIFVIGLTYYFVPNARVRLKDVWLGAIVSGFLWRVALAGFSWYLRDLSRFSMVHGSIAAVVAFLLWVYVSAVILLYGVEFTAALARLRRHRPEAIPAAPAPRI
jgi:membrane protein